MASTVIEGIDVSTYQGSIDWRQVRAAGKGFMAAKATEGTWFQDPTFPHNWQGAGDHGLIRFAYHFLRPNTDGSAQADYFHAYVRQSGRFQVGDGIALDVEVTDGQDATTILDGIEAFIGRIVQTTQCGIWVYTYPAFWSEQLLNASRPMIDKCPLWLADYGPSVPNIGGWANGLSAWQYADSGHCPGVPTEVDLDRFYGDRRQLSELARLGGRG